MKPTTTRQRGALAAALLALIAFVAGCAAPQATRVTDELPFEQAVVQATDGLVSQTQTLPAFLAKVESKIAKRGVVLDPMLDAGSGQQTGATQTLEKQVTEHMTAKYDQIEILPFQSSNLGKAQYLLTGTMTRVQTARSKKAALKINLALTELRSGNVVAQSSAVARDEGLDHNPLPYYRDSPVLLAKDKVVDGYVRTSATAPGQRADATYLERIATATLINEATTLYNSERYQDALGQYRSALATPAGEQLRVLNGIYLTNVKLGRMKEAEQAFGRVVAMGIAYNELGVKFLFNPGSTEFWSDTRISGAYGMWLRQIAREATLAKACMNIIGHTSRTGSEQANDALSLQRAAYVKQRLSSEAAELAARTKPVGMGFRQNIVGSGSDNSVDALDRRVEFKIVPCE
ncbi:OmpA family protein [Schlegelella sp. S2-27]|uniref:OmpA family protein n=1 Tax=Caldimonas mangrovi TaxID=2944811 RepID=A0ABT0YT71_9BURK|nr:OmpA family protein [Caldimonas mangrovi]MCM5681954.1 OmpA family protein [Caldimonas mangrovi]